MAGQDQNKSSDISVEELVGLSEPEQADKIADHYASISNLYEPLKTEDFPGYMNPLKCSPPQVSPSKVAKIIRGMNKKAEAVPGDLPIKAISPFSEEFSIPLALAHPINKCLSQGVYPNIWKMEYVSPVPKVFPPE